MGHTFFTDTCNVSFLSFPVKRDGIIHTGQFGEECSANRSACCRRDRPSLRQSKPDPRRSELCITKHMAPNLTSYCLLPGFWRLQQVIALPFTLALM